MLELGQDVGTNGAGRSPLDTTAAPADEPRAVVDGPNAADHPPRSVAEGVAAILWQLGVREAYGVCGREIARVWAALLATDGTDRPIRTMHTRHENGAGFAAVGSWAQTGRPAAVFVTTAPGLTNAITSLEMARAAGAKLIMLSPLTPASDSGRRGIQDTGPRGYYSDDLHREGRVFDLVAIVESAGQLPMIAGQLAAGLAGDGCYMAHIAVPTSLQGAALDAAPLVPEHRRPAVGVSSEVADQLVSLLAAEPFAVWVGWGARAHAEPIRRLLDLTGAPAMSSPRGLGIVDTHPGFIGVTGNGGRESLPAVLAAHAPTRTLVLGSGLGEATSGWLDGLVPPRGFIHVDLDPRVFGRAYPQAPTLGVQADIGEIVRAVLARSTRLVRRRPPAAQAVARAALPGIGMGQLQRAAAARPAAGPRPIHPAVLMAAIQRTIVESTDMPVLADAASAMFWAARHLVFAEPGRWFVENRFGAMGGAAGAVVGAAEGCGGPALAIVGDGAMHMQDEVGTAVRYGIPAIWVVLNDSGLGIVRAGMTANGWGRHDADFPPTDFAAVARAKGAAGLQVTSEQALDAALRAAVEAGGPFVVDVVIDPLVPPPIGARARPREESSRVADRRPWRARR